MENLSQAMELSCKIVNNAVSLGIAQSKISNLGKVGKQITIKGKSITSFSNCSYLGLEHDERLKMGAVEAIQKYGTQFSCSRAYLELSLYEEVEYLLSQIFGKPALLAPTTSLGHISLLPIVVGQNDAVIMDHQVHTSVKNAVAIVKGRGTFVDTIRHNRMDILEDRIVKLKDKYDKIWYMADGVYSMYGDVSPVEQIYGLMDKYEQFHCYLDDAHGMSWSGENGSGYFLSKMPYHEKLIFISSLAKGFGVCGGVMVLPNEELKSIVRNVGSTIMFSGPMQPANLGAAIASAKIHLSDEIKDKQNALMERIRYFNLTSKALGLPLVSDDRTPIFFVGVGTPETGMEICHNMMKSGYFLNIAAFPAVPYKNTGLRITLTSNHTMSDIHEMLTTLSDNIEKMEKSSKVSKQEIFKAFSLERQF
jgi:7-keto-8-aminopelargonate synthetase-like enzyme